MRTSTTRSVDLTSPSCVWWENIQELPCSRGCEGTVVSIAFRVTAPHHTDLDKIQEYLTLIFGQISRKLHLSPYPIWIALPLVRQEGIRIPHTRYQTFTYPGLGRETSLSYSSIRKSIPSSTHYPQLRVLRHEEADVETRQLGVVFEILRAFESWVWIFLQAFSQPPLNIFTKSRSLLRHPPLKDTISVFGGIVRPGEMLRECQITT